MLIVYSPSHHLHAQKKEIFNGVIDNASDKPDRISTIIHQLTTDYPKDLIFTDVLLDSGDIYIGDIHNDLYIQFLQSRLSTLSDDEEQFVSDRNYTHSTKSDAVGRGLLGNFCSDTYTAFTKNIWQVARDGYRAVYTAGEHTLKTGETSYALTRPSGHHAMATCASGYCYLANASIYASYLSKVHTKKVCILDIDYHHGNGAQMLFYSRNDIYTVSIHANPDRKFPYFTGHANEIGEGLGIGYNLNIPLEANIQGLEYIQHLSFVMNAIQSKDIDFLIVSVGYDTYKNDPICDFKLELQNYYTIGLHIKNLGISTLLVQEGGYDIESIGLCASKFIQPFLTNHPI